MHRRIWIASKGAIPNGYDVHHRNEDWQDNSLDNLCIMPKSDHMRMHTIDRLKEPHYYATRKKQLATAREKSKEWHASADGMRWHRDHAKRTLGRIPKKKIKCVHCGHEWMTTYHNARFCSRSCSATYHVMHVMEKTERKCEECGVLFMVPKVRKTRFCSPQCSAWGVAKIKAAKKGK